MLCYCTIYCEAVNDYYHWNPKLESIELSVEIYETKKISLGTLHRGHYNRKGGFYMRKCDINMLVSEESSYISHYPWCFLQLTCTISNNL